MQMRWNVVTYLVETQVALDGVGGEEDFTIAGQNQQETVQCLQF